MNRQTSMIQRRSGLFTAAGFTLIELLVVIAIIALLISMIMPALASAREEGRAVKCLANARTIVTTSMFYMEDQTDRKIIPWYQWSDEREDGTPGGHQGYPDNHVYTPWVFGGFKAPAPDPEDSPPLDSAYYPAQIRPLNKFIDPGAQCTDNFSDRGRDIIKAYICPSDRSHSTALIGDPAFLIEEEPLSAWQANGSSYTLNTRFMQGYEQPGGVFNVEDSDDWGERIARTTFVGGNAARFVFWVEQGFYSATNYAAEVIDMSNAAVLRRGWHRKYSKWIVAFADGHAMYRFYDTRLVHQGDGATIWEPGYDWRNDP